SGGARRSSVTPGSRWVSSWSPRRWPSSCGRRESYGAAPAWHSTFRHDDDVAQCARCVALLCYHHGHDADVVELGRGGADDRGSAERVPAARQLDDAGVALDHVQRDAWIDARELAQASKFLGARTELGSAPGVDDLAAADAG